MALSDGEILRYRISIGSPTPREERSLCPLCLCGYSPFTSRAAPIGPSMAVV